MTGLPLTHCEGKARGCQCYIACDALVSGPSRRQVADEVSDPPEDLASVAASSFENIVRAARLICSLACRDPRKSAGRMLSINDLHVRRLDSSSPRGALKLLGPCL